MSESLPRRLRILRQQGLRRLRRLRSGAPGGDHASVNLDMAGDSSTLLIAFGGLRGEMGIPPFEFFKATGELPVKRMFLRDLEQAWYHRGIPGYGTSIEELAASLGEFARANGVERLVTVGNSAGGYGALVCGTLMAADAVLCFAPQTCLDPAVRAEMGDERWSSELRRVIAAGALDRRWVDLGQALAPAQRGATRYRVFFDASLRLDRLHAERLIGVPGLTLYRFGRGQHSLVVSLRDCGALARILQGALAPAGSAEPA